MKTCIGCKEVLTEDKFRQVAKRKDGLALHYNKCFKEICITQKAVLKDPVEYKRWYEILRKYGLTKQDYQDMFQKQQGKCFICQESSNNLFIDHCHNTTLVRGLLCRDCNNAIGLLKDDPEILKRALLYLGK